MTIINSWFGGCRTFLRRCHSAIHSYFGQLTGSSSNTFIPITNFQWIISYQLSIRAFEYLPKITAAEIGTTLKLISLTIWNNNNKFFFEKRACIISSFRCGSWFIASSISIWGIIVLSIVRVDRQGAGGSLGRNAPLRRSAAVVAVSGHWIN